MSNKVKRTYGSRSNRKSVLPSSSPSRLSSSPVLPAKRKLPLDNNTSASNIPPPPKRVKPSGGLQKHKKKKLTQLHFCVDTSILRTCPLCDLSYTKGAPDDEILHKTHCARVQRGMEWGREEEKEKIKAGVVEVASGVQLKDGTKGRIVCFRADVGGNIGSKLTTLLETINLALSSPPLTTSALQASKAYLFLIPTTSTTSSRDKIAGCVIAQRISTAMAIADSECAENSMFTGSLISVDPTTSLFVHATPLPTPLGIPRMFVPRTHRRCGIATRLLSAAAATFIHGCPLDGKKGEVAFTQPTGMGAAVMRQWGAGGVRVYEG